MILCCPVCGNHSKSNDVCTCEYCGNEMECLISEEESLAYQSNEEELNDLIEIIKTKYESNDNALYNEALWTAREYKEDTVKKQVDQVTYDHWLENHMLTTGYDFQGYTIKSYIGLVSGETVMGTGILSEMGAGFSDFFGRQSNMFSKEMGKAKEKSIEKMIENIRKGQ